MAHAGAALVAAVLAIALVFMPNSAAADPRLAAVPNTLGSPAPSAKPVAFFGYGRGYRSGSRTGYRSGFHRGYRPHRGYRGKQRLRGYERYDARRRRSSSGPRAKRTRSRHPLARSQRRSRAGRPLYRRR